MFAAEGLGVTPGHHGAVEGDRRRLSLAAVVCRRSAEAVRGDGRGTSHTFGSNPIAQAAALTVIEIMRAGPHPRARRRGWARSSRRGLKALQAELSPDRRHPRPGSASGRRASVTDPETPGAGVSRGQAAGRRGLEARGDPRDGIAALPNVIKIKPPLIIDEGECVDGGARCARGLRLEGGLPRALVSGSGFDFQTVPHARGGRQG